MTAIRSTHWQEIHAAVRRLHARTLQVNPYPELTADEVVQWFAPPDIASVLISVGKCAEIPYPHTSISHIIPSIGRITFWWISGSGPLAPRYPRLQPGVEEGEAWRKVVDWAAAELSISYNFGCVDTLLKYLRPNTLEEVRHYFPSIVALLKMSEATAHLADKVQEYRRPKNIASLTYTYNEVAKQATRAIGRALMLPDLQRQVGDKLVKSQLMPSSTQTTTVGGVEVAPLYC